MNVAAGLLLAWSSALASVPSGISDGYRRITADFPRPVLVNADFNTGTTGWELPVGYSHDPRGGRSGTGALKMVRTDSTVYTLAVQRIKLIPQVRYRFGIWVRTEGVAGEDSGGTICLEFSDEKGWMGGHYPNGLKGTTDWTWVEGSVAVPERAVGCTLTLYLRQGMTGTVWFDDAKIEPEAGVWTAHQIYPSHESVDAESGRIVLASLDGGMFLPPPQKVDEADLVCRIRAVRDGRTIREAEASVKGGRIVVDLGRTDPGQVELKLVLLDTRRKLLLGECSVPVTVARTGKPPANACILDERGRAMVSGRPFLPVGLYFSSFELADLDRMAAGPFNCLMPYGSLTLKLQGSAREGLAAVREALDACQARSLKVIFSIKDVYAGTTWETVEFSGARGEAEVVKKAVTGLKDHPALLAWYVNDELSLAYLPRLVSRRREVNRLDPWHPTWAVLYQFDELEFYRGTCDVLGIDPYPIKDGTTKDMRLVLNGLESAASAVGTGDGMALWVVPQVFNQGAYGSENRETFLKTNRDPTEAEMRAMALLCALKGAKGFVFYSYFDLLKPQTKPDFDRRWSEICRVGALLRELEPFLLSSRPTEPVQVAAGTGQVLARSLVSDAGKRCVLVAGVGPGESKATLKLDPGLKFKARFGLASSAGQGAWTFSGMDICADILEEQK